MNRNRGISKATRATVAAVLLMLALVTPALGGLQCQLQATVGGGSATIVETGEEVLIEGFGFPSGAEVFITYTVGTTVVGDETITASATGTFETTVTPQPGQEGLWTVEADVPKQCTATTAFEVVAGPTPTPSPTPTPTSVPTAAPTPVQGELPDVATTEPPDPTPLVLGGLILLAAAAWLSRIRLARLLR